jgi:hypothetical protein
MTHITKEALLLAIEEQYTTLDYAQNGVEEARIRLTMDHLLARAAELSAQTPEGFCPKCNTRIGVHGGCDCGFCSPKLSAQESKPVAWIHGEGENGSHDWGKHRNVRTEYFNTPVYLATPSVSAQDASPKDGWKLVPLQPTQAMLDAGVKAGVNASGYWCPETWRAMLAAAPEPPKDTKPSSANDRAMAHYDE